MLKLDQHSRLAFIEFILYWEAEIQSRTLTSQFAISRQQAWQDLRIYCERFPKNCLLDGLTKAYRVLPTFCPQIVRPNLDDYLNWVANPSCIPQFTCEKTSPTASLKLPQRQVNLPTIRQLVKAKRASQRAEVDYVSLKNPNREGRIITPHSFFNTGLRWHLRAWCEKHREYRDFVLSRFRGDVELLGRSEMTGENDSNWHKEIELIFVPDRRLSPEQRAVIAHDYAMEDGELCVNTRAALAHYLLQQMQVNVTTLHANPEAQQLELVNINDVKEWLFH
ncbi:MAG: WYL domain-containing protein [Aliidiomarina sp.]|uniref:WYL domain-containing protein n=1 Tax=Aliidiomarina sp. TaxID=1872439 RepID=UPI0025C4C3C2|nr:WYL domain-containing protein [Aliidiomarina sp.]MCH8501522.1 WYL domain-containing protein [Aliidiomarina sp.]